MSNFNCAPLEETRKDLKKYFKKMVTLHLSAATNSCNKLLKKQNLIKLPNQKSVMKKFILALFIISASVTMLGISSETSYAKSGGGGGTSNKIPASQVPSPVRMSFGKDFPTAKQTEWEFTPIYYGTPFYTASFKLNGAKWQANYYADGTLMSSGPKS